MDDLIRTRERLLLAQEAAGLGIHDFDVRTGAIEWDSYVRGLWGADPEEVITYELFMAGLHPDDRAPTEAAVRAALDPGGEGRYAAEYRVIHRHTKQMRWVVATGKVIFADGTAARLVGTVQDITARKAVEESLRHAREALEHANHAKDRFLAQLSHELRTPLTPVLAAASALADDKRLPEDARDELRSMAKNIGLEVALIDDMLDVTRIVHGKLTLIKAPTDIQDVLLDVGRILATDLDAKEQTLVINAPDGACNVLGDRARLYQVFWNLIKNASKFSPVRGVIQVRASIDGDTVEVQVRDSGQGMAVEDQKRLFKPFEQLRTAQWENAGLGLGLAICKGLVELHAGTITAASDGPGKGSTFTVRLPCARVEAASATDRRSTPATGPTQRGPLRILYVEDHVETARVISRLLRQEGHDVVHAASLREGLVRLSETYDALICDLSLPDGSGHDLMHAVKAASKEVHAIAVSGHGSPADIDRSLQAGFKEHLVKPLGFDVIQQALLRVRGVAVERKN